MHCPGDDNNNCSTKANSNKSQEQETEGDTLDPSHPLPAQTPSCHPSRTNCEELKREYFVDVWKGCTRCLQEVKC